MYDDYRLLGLGDLTLKPGVFGSPTEAIQFAIGVAEQVYGRHGLPLRITSLQDGQHACCAHPEGRAVDLGTKDPATGRQWPASLKNQLAGEIRAGLGGGAGFRVLVESDHIHIQSDTAGVPGGGSSAPAPAPGAGSSPASSASSGISNGLLVGGGLLLLWLVLK